MLCGLFSYLPYGILAQTAGALAFYFGARFARLRGVTSEPREIHLERFILVGTMLATGLAGFRLEPLPLLLGLIVGQFAWMFAMLALKID